MEMVQAQTHCPDCGTRLSNEPWSLGLCVPCLADLAVAAPSLHAEIAFDPDEPATLLSPAGTLSGGQTLGNRYRIRSLLGRGGMGEVWRAFDLKLRVDVALKALRGPLLQTAGALDLLRSEVRSAREVISPSVCRVFDIEEVEELPDRELVSMEYIDGQTLTELLRALSPLELGEAREIAAQFLAGLEAIHSAGLAHRDFKPENVMITRSGRVVVMDFGIAKELAEGRQGTVSGTPAYMAPEQSRGEAVDARADVFSAGVVLAEMIAPEGVASREARVAVTQGVHHEPPVLADTPWRGVLEKAVARNREDRHESASALARALEEVALRVEGAEDLEPYPGLAAFTEEDSEYFFGRELEVEKMWRKLRRPHLLAMVGPSGAGKSSFLRAGLLPAMPEDWRTVIASPGNRPFMALGEALVDELSGDADAMRELLRFEEADVAVSLVSRWRQQHGNALVIVDQFEELFTQNPLEVQERFAELLGRLALEADTHVLLAIRDDFLFHCQPFEALAPILSELTLLGTLTGSALRRALVQPALRCGYRFEDEALADEMVAEVKNERGALPMLAFAAAQLWEHRDREQGLLTREAYEHIGGVGGALAQHAETTLERVGRDRVDVVRELFRNLVTAEGTRAARSRGELVSIFGENREAGAEVLDALIDARLLTSYELPAADGEEEPGQDRVEIVHESLLRHWPRLVRWQTQDAEGAQLRDELRQAAQMWEQHERSSDLLWTGTTYREFELWREHYPGALTEVEEAFAEATVHEAGRVRRLRRRVVSAGFAVLLLVGLVITGLWRRSEAETLRAEAARVLLLGERELEDYPTGAVAYALRSLELADTADARGFALRALQKGPALSRMAWAELDDEADRDNSLSLDFSPDGQWLAVGGYKGAILRSWDGERYKTLKKAPTEEGEVSVRFGPQSDLVITRTLEDIRFSSFPDLKEIGRGVIEGPTAVSVREAGAFTRSTVGDEAVVRWWSLDGKQSRVVGRMETMGASDIDPTGSWLAYRSNSRPRELFVRSLEDWSQPPRLVAEHADDIVGVGFQPGTDRIAAGDKSGEIRIWSLDSRAGEPVRILRGRVGQLRFNDPGTVLAAYGDLEGRKIVELWQLTGPQATEPTVLSRSDGLFMNNVAFDPTGRWLAATHAGDESFWPLGGRYSRVFTGHAARVFDLAFAPDSSTLYSVSNDGVRAWDLTGHGKSSRVVFRGSSTFSTIDVDPSGRHLIVAQGFSNRVALVQIDGEEVRELEGFSPSSKVSAATFDDSGRFAAVAPWTGPAEDRVVRVWDLQTGEVRVLGPVPAPSGSGDLAKPISQIFGGLAFSSDGQIFSIHEDAVIRWDLESGAPDVLSRTGGAGDLLLTRDNDQLMFTNPQLFRYDLVKEDVVGSHGTEVFAAALDPSETLVATGGFDGIVRVGPITGEEPHLLFGHEGIVFAVAFSPDGRWIASSGADQTVRLWPVPEGRPFHTLPYEELLERLRSATNLRAVADEESRTGYRLDAAPFPGWQTVPEWWHDEGEK